MIYFNFKNRLAFTMIELILVIIVLGILASLAIPRLDRDVSQEAADRILSDIRYTQHLALTDDKHSYINPKWQKAFWRIGFESCANGTGFYEYIGSDIGYEGAIGDDEAATDPINGKKMIWSNLDDCSNGGDSNTSENIFLTTKYGVSGITWGGSCAAAQYIGFDHLGRIHQGFAGAAAGAADVPRYATYLNARCTIKFDLNSGGSFTINIEPETGYAFIDTQDAS